MLRKVPVVRQQAAGGVSASSGIGVRFTKLPTGPCKIMSIVPGGPAALTTQLSTNDYIHALNGQDVYDMSVTEVVNSILGKHGTVLTLTVSDQPETFTNMQHRVHHQASYPQLQQQASTLTGRTASGQPHQQYQHHIQHQQQHPSINSRFPSNEGPHAKGASIQHHVQHQTQQNQPLNSRVPSTEGPNAVKNGEGNAQLRDLVYGTPKNAPVHNISTPGSNSVSRQDHTPISVKSNFDFDPENHAMPNSIPFHLSSAFKFQEQISTPNQSGVYQETQKNGHSHNPQQHSVSQHTFTSSVGRPGPMEASSKTSNPPFVEEKHIVAKTSVATKSAPAPAGGSNTVSSLVHSYSLTTGSGQGTQADRQESSTNGHQEVLQQQKQSNLHLQDSIDKIRIKKISDDRAIAISSSASEIEKMKNQQSAYSWYAENYASHSVDASSVISTYTNITEGKGPDKAPATSYIPPNQKSINLAEAKLATSNPTHSTSAVSAAFSTATLNSPMRNQVPKLNLSKLEPTSAKLSPKRMESPSARHQDKHAESTKIVAVNNRNHQESNVSTVKKMGEGVKQMEVPTPAVKVPTPQRALPSDILSPVRLRHTPLETILAQSPNPSNSRSPLVGRRVTPIGKSKGSAFEVVTPRSPARSSNNLTNASHVGKPKTARTDSSEDDGGFPNAYTLTVKKRCCNAASVAYEIEVCRRHSLQSAQPLIKTLDECLRLQSILCDRYFPLTRHSDVDASQLKKWLTNLVQYELFANDAAVREFFEPVIITPRGGAGGGALRDRDVQDKENEVLKKEVQRLKEYLGKSNTQLESSADEINKWKAEAARWRDMYNDRINSAKLDDHNLIMPVHSLTEQYPVQQARRNLQLNAHQDSAHTERDNANFSHVAIEISSFPQAGSAAGVRDGNPSGHTAHSGGVGGRRVSNGTEVPKSGGPLDSKRREGPGALFLSPAHQSPGMHTARRLTPIELESTNARIPSVGYHTDDTSQGDESPRGRVFLDLKDIHVSRPQPESTGFLSSDELAQLREYQLVNPARSQN